MNYNNIDYISGVIVSGGNRVHIRTRIEYLILDCASYGRELLICHEDAVAELHRSDELRHKATAAMFSRTLGELRQWLSTQQGSVPSVRPLARRIELQNYLVTARELRTYLALVISLSRGADGGSVPKFVLHADPPAPVLFATRRLRLLAAHTGPSILGVVESDEELAIRVELAVATWSLQH